MLHSKFKGNSVVDSIRLVISWPRVLCESIAIIWGFKGGQVREKQRKCNNKAGVREMLFLTFKMEWDHEAKITHEQYNWRDKRQESPLSEVSESTVLRTSQCLMRLRHQSVLQHCKIILFIFLSSSDYMVATAVKVSYRYQFQWILTWF